MKLSKTNEQALEASIEKRLTGICLEELKEQNIALNTVNERK
jgi:type I restriction enzyme R subunit